MKPVVIAFTGAALLGACATTPTPPPQQPPSTAPSAPQTPSRLPPAPEGPTFELRAAAHADLPGWSETDLAPALAAFRRSCAAIARRPDESPLGRTAAYGGVVRDWRPACAAAEAAADPRAFFETQFTPHEVVARFDQMKKLTGYYEPVIEARRAPAGEYDEPFLARPADLVSVDLSLFDDATDLSRAITDDVMKGLAPVLEDAAEPRAAETLNERLERRFRTPIWGRLTADRRIAPYPKREGVDLAKGVLGYGRPCDVYDVQVQGSARVRFEDGAEMRMAYAAQNGWKWSSIYPQLRSRGAPSANKAGVCAWMAGQQPAERRAAMNLDPSYVFFELQPIGDPAAGPKGAQGAPLTPEASMAVDPAAHPYGAVIFVEAEGAAPDGGPGPFRRLVVAQDTGGAIRRGPLRGDMFFGTGPDAGAKAERMNAPVRFWTLLPRGQQAQLTAPVAATR